MKIELVDRLGWPIETYINNPIRSFIRIICQALKGNLRIKFKD